MKKKTKNVWVITDQDNEPTLVVTKMSSTMRSKLDFLNCGYYKVECVNHKEFKKEYDELYNEMGGGHRW